MDTSILVIAGSDSCAGAGAQIDIKTAAAHGVHACCAITALTAQNTREVTAIESASSDMMRAQIEAVFDDMPPAAIKIGMLGNADVASAVVEALSEHSDVPIVLDPVLVATAGATLTEASVFELVRDRLIPASTLVTPNIPEASELTGIEVVDEKSSRAAAQSFMDMGAHAVFIKGGHGTQDTIVDRLYCPDRVYEYTTKRLPGEYHGTGCSISTAIACNLACGLPLEQAVREGHEYIGRALANPLELGRGVKVFDPLRASKVWKRQDNR